jgi:hypothetical protein
LLNLAVFCQFFSVFLVEERATVEEMTQKWYIKKKFDFKNIPIFGCKTNAQIVGDLKSMLKTVHYYFETAALSQK